MRSVQAVRSVLVLALMLVTLGVRGAPTCIGNLRATTPSSDFADNGNGTVLHKPSGLTWMRCALGYNWNGSSCSGEGTVYPWQVGLGAAAKLNAAGGYAGQRDWRVPNAKELASIVEGQCYYPAINTQIFPNTPATVFWTSSGHGEQARYVTFGTGDVGHYLGTNINYVRLVRGGNAYDNQGIGQAAKVSFMRETLGDGSFVVGPAVKSWTFKNGGDAIVGLRAVRIAGRTDAGLGIVAEQIELGTVGPGSEFTASLAVNAQHAGAPSKSSYWKLVDANGVDVAISNSPSGQFWLRLRTNRAPEFSPMQLDSFSLALAGPGAAQKVAVPVLASDADGDSVTVSGGGASAVLAGGSAVLPLGSATPGIHRVELTISDGIESRTRAVDVIVTDGTRAPFQFADVRADGAAECQGAADPAPARYYGPLMYLALKGIAIGVGNAQGGRTFQPCAPATQAEALKLIMLAARARGLVTLDAAIRALPNLVRSDPAAGVYENYSWVAPYLLKAEALGVIGSAAAFEPAAPVTRAWLAGRVASLMRLDRMATLGVVPAATGFPDGAAFESADELEAARSAAFFGYLGQFGERFEPASPMVRADVGLVASRIVRTPSASAAILDGLQQQSVQGRAVPALQHGQQLRISGLHQLDGNAYLQNGEQVIDDWITPVKDYVSVSVIRDGAGALAGAQGIGAGTLAQKPIVVPTADLPLAQSEVRKLLLVLEDSKSGVRAVLRAEYGVLFPDRDGDGVRDDLDPWPDHATLSMDTNANGIPDNVDEALGTQAARASDPITIGTVQTTLIQAILDGQLEAVRVSQGGAAAVPRIPETGRVISDSSSVSVEIVAPPADGTQPVLRYDLDCRDDKGQALSTSASASPLRMAGLSAGSGYRCTVVAGNAAGSSAPSAEFAFVARLDAGVPPVPDALTASAEQGVIRLDFIDSPGPSVSYQASCISAGAMALQGTASASPVRIAGAEAGRTYSCAVLASNAYGNSVPTAAVTVSVPAPAGLATLAIDVADREAVRYYYNGLYPLAGQVPMGWSGDYASGKAGTTSTQFRAAVAERINWFRGLAGVPATVELDEQWSAKAQQMALMISVNGRWDHFPPSSWTFWTQDGREAAARSNLYFSLSGTDAISGYMMDHGFNNRAVGHRRWLLRPQSTRMGSGDVPGGSFNGAAVAPANALWVIPDVMEPRGAVAVRDDFVAWPPAGFVPYPVVPVRWSFSYPDADFSEARVQMQRAGQELSTTLEPIENGTGENTLVWLPQGYSDLGVWARPGADERYTVTVSNVKLAGAMRSFTYEVVVFDPAVPTAGVPQNRIGPLQAGVAGQAYPLTVTAYGTPSAQQVAVYRRLPLAFPLVAPALAPAWHFVGGSYPHFDGLRYHLQHGENNFGLQTLTLDKRLLVGTNASLSFRSHFGVMTTETETALVEVSDDDGASWQVVDTQSGVLAGSVAATRVVGLGAYAGRAIRIRFTLVARGFVYYAPGSGWFIDAVSLANVDEIVPVSVGAMVPAGTGLTLIADEPGYYLVAARSQYQGRYTSEWGALTPWQVDQASGPAPALRLTASALSFSGANGGDTQQVMLLNAGTGAATLGAISIAGDFSATSTCGVTLAASAHCMISVRFVAQGSGVRSGSLFLTGAARETSIALLGSPAPARVAAAPPAPVASAGNGLATLSLAAPSDDGGTPVTGYTVTSHPAGGVDLGAGTLSLTRTISGLVNGTSYTFTVIAHNAAGASPMSLASQAIIPLAPPEVLVPAVPEGLSAVAAGSSLINVGWSGVSGAATYRLYRDGILIASPIQPAHADAGLAPAQIYRYAVAACDAAGNCSAPSSPAGATTSALPDTVAPEVPAGLATNAAGAGQIALSWRAASDNVGVAGYRVYRDGVLIASPATLSYLDPGAQAAQTYRYAVAACDMAGNCSALSPTVSAAAAAQAPGAPSIISVQAGGASAWVLIEPPAESGSGPVSGYTVTTLPAGGVDSHAGSTALSHLVTGLSNGVSYRFVVTATNHAGPGPASGPSDPITPAVHLLNVAVEGSGTVSSSPAGIACPGQCSAQFGVNSSVSLVATPDDRVTFLGWTGACSGTGACTIRIGAAIAVGARFSAVGYSGDDMVADAEHGLMWMRCAIGQSWTGKTCSGTAATMGWDEASALTGTVSFGGYSDWRLPGVRELGTIVQRAQAAPRIDVIKFPSTPSARFWTATEFAPSPSQAWQLDFGFGVSQNGAKSEARAVRLVRTASLRAALLGAQRDDTQYVDHGNGAVTHAPTGLMWARCVQGQFWNGAQCGASAAMLTLAAAQAQRADIGGHADWRLPTIPELETLVDYAKPASPVLSEATFLDSPSLAHWSSTPAGPAAGWSVTMSSGAVLPHPVGSPAAVRLVRRGQMSVGAVEPGNLVRFGAARSQYTITRAGDRFAVTDNAGREGTALLATSLRLHFADAMVALDVDGDGIAGRAYRLYRAAFKRTPDTAGLGYWIAFLDRGASLDEVAGLFVASTEFKSLYGDAPSNAAIVEALYANVLHRTPDAAGYAYWLAALDAGLSRSSILIQFSESGENRSQVSEEVGAGIVYEPYPAPGK